MDACCFYLGTVVSSAAVNLGVQIPLLVLAFNSSGYICGNSMFDFF